MQRTEPFLIWKKIKLECLRQGYTAEAYVKKAKYNISTISRMENGIALHLEKLAIVANTLKIDVREVIEAGIIEENSSGL